jgi:high-affinity iron transporter
VIPAFVIALREGVEASLVVGIVGAFLIRADRRDALRPMWLGVACAVALSLAVGVALELVDSALPQREQEGFETVVALVAAVTVTAMIVWVRRNGSRLRSVLEGEAAGALERGSALALVGVAFFAVLREGFETAVFLLAAFEQSARPAATGTGAVLGLAAAVLLGYTIFRGGARINMGRFFRVTGIVLVLVAAGLVASAVHTAHEADWLNSLQTPALDLSGLIRPNSVVQSLVTGMLGVQPTPTVAEVTAWLVYATPMLVFLFWPARRRPQSGRPAVGAA